MIKLKDLQAVNTYEDLENLGIGNVICNISHRGGGLGFSAEDVAEWANVNISYLPNKYGAGCNYLGGGLRGKIFVSGFSDIITGKKARLLTELAKACIRVYEYVENINNLNDEECPDGETNWEAIGTNRSRKAGIESAY